MHQALAGACSLISLSMICTSRSEQPESAAPDEERDLVTELHPQPAAERGHENGGDMVDGLSHGHGRGDVLRFGYLLEESTQGDGEIEHDVVDDVEHARDPRAARVA